MSILLLIILSLIVLAFILILALILISRYAQLSIKYKRLSRYLHSYLNLITHARYGNLNLSCDDGIDALTIQLSRNTNGLLESIVDRDKMISEYIEKEKQSQNLKQDFISSLAHDLKVPIIAQDNTYDLFLNGALGEISSIQKEAINNLKISNNDLKNLVLDLLDAHKLDKKELELNIQKVDIIELIKEVIDLNKSIVTIKNKVINFNSQFEEYFYPIDVFLFKRVLNNLISNAIFYGKNTQNIIINFEKKSKTIEISVSDEGDGINQNDINKIFKKYYTSAKKYSNVGVGLGLYIANKIIVAHNGKIKAKNNPEKGATFTISLPM